MRCDMITKYYKSSKAKSWCFRGPLLHPSGLGMARDGQGCTAVGTPWPGRPTAESWRPPEHWGNSEEFRVHVASLGWHIPQVSWSGPVSNLGGPFLSNDLNPLKYSRWIGVTFVAAAIRNSQRSPQTIMAVGATVTFGSCISSIADRLYRYVYIIYVYMWYIYIYINCLYNYI